jgi:hypothetical protein
MIKNEKAYDSLLNYRDFFNVLLPYLHCTSRGSGVGSRATYRIELKTTIPPELAQRAIAFTMSCVACVNRINPLRSREKNLRGKSVGVYYSATCPTAISNRCCRTKLATAEFELIARVVHSGAGCTT